MITHICVRTEGSEAPHPGSRELRVSADDRPGLAGTRFVEGRLPGPNGDRCIGFGLMSLGFLQGYHSVSLLLMLLLL